MIDGLVVRTDPVFSTGILQGFIRVLEDTQVKAGCFQVHIALLRDRNTQSVVLSDGPEPKITATVWHNPVRRTTVLDINSLPAPAPGKYFQFWAIVNGKPVSMGMVQLRGADSWQTLPYIAEASAFAISAEDNPEGNAAPTAVVLIGNV